MPHDRVWSVHENTTILYETLEHIEVSATARYGADVKCGIEASEAREGSAPESHVAADADALRSVRHFPAAARVNDGLRKPLPIPPYIVLEDALCPRLELRRDHKSRNTLHVS